MRFVAIAETSVAGPIPAEGTDRLPADLIRPRSGADRRVHRDREDGAGDGARISSMRSP